MTQYGLLIDYDYCDGCHACEVACKVDHGFQEGFDGIQLFQIGPRELSPDHWEYTYIPAPTELCDLCAERVAAGKLPTCVHHCQSLAIEYGTVEELAARVNKPKMVIFSVKDGA